MGRTLLPPVHERLRKSVRSVTLAIVGKRHLLFHPTAEKERESIPTGFRLLEQLTACSAVLLFPASQRTENGLVSFSEVGSCHPSSVKEEVGRELENLGGSLFEREWDRGIATSFALLPLSLHSTIFLTFTRIGKTSRSWHVRRDQLRVPGVIITAQFACRDL